MVPDKSASAGGGSRERGHYCTMNKSPLLSTATGWCRGLAVSSRRRVAQSAHFAQHALTLVVYSCVGHGACVRQEQVVPQLVRYRVGRGPKIRCDPHAAVVWPAAPAAAAMAFTRAVVSHLHHTSHAQAPHAAAQCRQSACKAAVHMEPPAGAPYAGPPCNRHSMGATPASTPSPDVSQPHKGAGGGGQQEHPASQGGMCSMVRLAGSTRP